MNHINKSNQFVCPKTGRVIEKRANYWWVKWLFPVSGLFAFIWFLVRVIPKPSRAMYPCQRVAAPLACTFITWIVGLTASILAYRTAKSLLRRSRFVLASVFAVLSVMIIWLSLGMPGRQVSAAFVPSDPPNTPMGTARGINPGRVYWVHARDATSWDGVTGYWWDDNSNDQQVIDEIVSIAVRGLTEQPSDAAAWDALFRYLNQIKGKGNVGYQAGEKIVIKINMNNSASGNMIDASPHMVLAVLRQLINKVGVQQSLITVYDAQRGIGAPVYNHCHPEFLSVNFNVNIGWVLNQMLYSAEVTDTNAKRLPQCVLDAEYMINMAILKRHDAVAPVTLCAKNHFGTIGSPSALHTFVQSWTRGMGKYDPLVDILGHKQIGGKTILYMIDGLYAGSSWGAIPTKWQIAPFNNDWPSSVFVSQDPVAIDSVGIDFLRAQMSLKNYADNYLHEAAQANSPPSGIFYDPEADGIRLTSLGSHEHWNNAADKKYTRNLETGDGIELIRFPLVAADFNRDGAVDESDVQILSGSWLDTGIWP